jgi:phage shock protein A
MEKARKEITDKALKDTQSKVKELTKSVNVLKNRNKALEVEISVLRIQIQKLMSKAEVDSGIIEQLKVLINIFLFIFINLI